MLLVLAISIPLYVCTTGSVPIAASLIAAGMPAGTALVFLMAGPATNVATLGAVYRTLGGLVLGLYLGVVILMSILFGLSFDSVLQLLPGPARPHDHGGDWIGVSCAVTLTSLLAFLAFRRLTGRIRRALSPKRAGADDRSGLTLAVEGMSCGHCVANVKKSLEELDGVEEADPDLPSGMVRVRGARLDAAVLADAVERAGYRVRGRGGR
jgi:copper chaperone CopZ